jgi:hypothetical protein
VSHSSEAVVINIDSQKVVGQMPIDGFSHGVAFGSDLNLGFITDGDAIYLSAGDLK